MYISKIVNYNRGDSEAELCISDGNYSVICYAYPIENIALNQEVDGIYGFLCTDITKSFERRFYVDKLSQYYAYLLTAEVVSAKNCTVKVGELKIYLDTTFSNDILEGDYISFRVQRLDLIQS